MKISGRAVTGDTTGAGPASEDVTVLVPTFNRAEILAHTLESLVNQTLKCRTVVVDDCSTDRTAEVCAAFSRVDYVRNEGRLGLFANWNRALSLVETEFVSICHDDDIYDHRLLERQRQALLTDPSIVMVHTGCRVIDDDGSELSVYVGRWPAVMSGEQLRHLLAGRLASPIAAPSVMLRTEPLRTIGGFDESLRVCSDIKAWIELGRLGAVAFIAEPLASIRHRGRHANEHAGFDWRIVDEHLRVAEWSDREVHGRLRFRRRVNHQLYIGLFLFREIVEPSAGRGSDVVRRRGSRAIKLFASTVPTLSRASGGLGPLRGLARRFVPWVAEFARDCALWRAKWRSRGLGRARLRSEQTTDRPSE